jgi:hypothetical protein
MLVYLQNNAIPVNTGLPRNISPIIKILDKCGARI